MHYTVKKPHFHCLGFDHHYRFLVELQAETSLMVQELVLIIVMLLLSLLPGPS